MVARQRGSKAATARKLDDEGVTATTGTRPLGAVQGGASAPLALDRIIHEHVRLAIVSALAVSEVLTFNDLKQLLDVSDGNLSVHARKLEEAGYVGVRKSFDGRIPRTEFRLTAAGRRALERYLAHMEALIKRVGGE
jgi:DNA-binding HxlR family transcriptional regulator